MHRAWIGIGSNLGDRLGYIKRGLGMIAALPGTEIVSISSVYDTRAVGLEDQPRFLNAAAELKTDLDARSLLNHMLAIEDRCGRIRRESWRPRTLDLDLLVFDDLQVEEPELMVPHPRMAKRAFVLVPLEEISPELIAPGLSGNIRVVLKELGDVEGDVTRVGGPPTPCTDARTET